MFTPLYYDHAGPVFLSFSSPLPQITENCATRSSNDNNSYTSQLWGLCLICSPAIKEARASLILFYFSRVTKSLQSLVNRQEAKENGSFLTSLPRQVCQLYKLIWACLTNCLCICMRSLLCIVSNKYSPTCWLYESYWFWW